MQLGTEKFATALGDTDLTARQLVILQAVLANEGASQTAIVGITGVDRSTLAEIIRRLVGRRLIARKRSKQDARAYILTLTDAGRNAVKKAEPVLLDVEKDILAAIPAKERSALLGALKSIAVG
jgi:DNA-binding MarR family transcriptional regulator